MIGLVNPVHFPLAFPVPVGSRSSSCPTHHFQSLRKGLVILYPYNTLPFLFSVVYILFPNNQSILDDYDMAKSWSFLDMGTYPDLGSHQSQSRNSCKRTAKHKNALDLPTMKARGNIPKTRPGRRLWAVISNKNKSSWRTKARKVKLLLLWF